MIFMKISQNFIKSHLKFWLISQISVHKFWHVFYDKKIKTDTFFLLPTFSGTQNASQ